MIAATGWRCVSCRAHDAIRPRGAVTSSFMSIGATRSRSDRVKPRMGPLGRLANKLGFNREKTPTKPAGNDARRPRVGGRKDFATPRSSPRSRNADSHVPFDQQFRKDLETMQKALIQPQFRLDIGITDLETRDRCREFLGKLMSKVKSWDEPGHKETPLESTIRAAYSKGHVVGRDTVRYWLQHHVAKHQLPNGAAATAAIDELTDLTNPMEWFPTAREIIRDIHIHVGPTNSGKTYHALKSLEGAAKGMYAGPLRLLAYEIYHRLNAAGKPCDLLTGDMRISAETEEPNADVPMLSCTVEMTPFEQSFDVAVIDEVQLIADDLRGSAWTNALLGVKARQVHLCGEESALPLVKSIVASMGDRLHVHKYERLNPLEVMPKSLHGDLSKLQPGDCIVAFSKRAIHMLREEIERRTKRKVAVIYGTLPPETRSQQAALFNDPSNDYDYLVASDAIGMGLNLNIKRMIFSDTMKSDGYQFVQLQNASIRQIAGRAGRFRVAPSLPSLKAPSQETKPSGSAEPDLAETLALAPSQTTGLVTTLAQEDFSALQVGMASAVVHHKRAGLWPLKEMIVKFASLHPATTPLSYILRRMVEICKVKGTYKIHDNHDYYRVADILQSFPNLQIQERITITEAPISRRSDILPMLEAILRRLDERRSAPLLELTEFNLDLLDRVDKFDNHYLSQLEILHEALGLYNWLSYRFEAFLVSRPLATHVALLVEKRIEHVLSTLAADFVDIRKKNKQKKTALQIWSEQNLQGANWHRQGGRTSQRQKDLPTAFAHAKRSSKQNLLASFA